MRRSWRRKLRRLRRRLRYHRHAPRVRRGILWGGGLLLGLGLVWIAVTGLLARNQLADIQTRIGQVKVLVAAGRIDDARRVATDIPAMARRAHRLTTGPAWWAASGVPYLGEPLDVARGTATAAERVGTGAIPQLLDVATQIDPKRLRAAGNSIRLQPLVAAAPTLARAARAIDRAVGDLHRLPSSTWVGAVDDGRARVTAQLDAVRGYVDAAARVSAALPDMLGAKHPQRYFIGLQNEAELRGTGGLPGAFAIAVASHGTIKFTHFESDAALLPARTRQRVVTNLKFGHEYDQLYSASQPTTSFIDSNVSPHFPYAAQIWATMWQEVSGEHVDAAIALDPTVLSYFLTATGPAVLPDHRVVSARNVVPLTQRDNYTLFSDNGKRKAFLVSILRAAAKKIISGAGTPLGLVQVASLAAKEQRLLAWSRDPAIERVLEQTNYAGAIPRDDRPLSAVILNNSAAGKLDYYLSRSLQYSRTGCGSRRDVLVTITLRNDAPASGLPGYVTTRLDTHPPADAKPGDSRVLLDYYATKDALLHSVTINGQSGTASAATALGHAVFRLDVELPRGATQTIVLHLDEPAGQGKPRIWRQPGVTPLAVQQFDQPCG